MRLAREPALFFSVYAHKHLPGFLDEDPRLLVLQQVDRFAARYGLLSVGPPWRYQCATDIDLVKLDRSPPEFDPLLNLARDAPASETDPRTLFQCLAYCHLDTLVVQVFIGEVDSWADSLAEGWTKLSDRLRAGFDGRALEAADRRIFGASVVYWAIADQGVAPADYREDLSSILGEVPPPRYSETDLGPLWQSDTPIFPEAKRVSQDRWLLVTPKEAEDEVNARYYLPRVDYPPGFAVVALARHKSAFERREYVRESERLERTSRSLDRRAHWMVQAQRSHAAELAELRSRESIEFQQKLARAETNLADYDQSLSRFKELHRTLEVNRQNFLVHSASLVSGAGRRTVATAPDQTTAASAVLALWAENHPEGIFRSQLGRMQGLIDQLDADVAYADLLVERHGASLRSGMRHLQIAGQRQLATISHHITVDTAAVVASLAVVVAAELSRFGDALAGRPILFANLLLLAVTGTFALVLLLGGEGGTKPERGSFALAAGFLVGILGLFEGSASSGWVGREIVAVAAGALLGALGRGYVELWLVRSRRERHRRKAQAEVTLDKLIYATEELADLLDDLPPTETFRIKDQESLLTKIERKNAALAAQRGMSVADLAARGESYAITDVNDAIGIRYVVLPWRVAEVVERIADVTHQVGIDYKEQVTTLGRVIQVIDGRKVEVDDPSYQGKYRGFRGTYRSVHVDVDLWGVGARKDVNLLAEIQVRTPFQDWYASWFHDVMYKEDPDPPEPPAPGAWRGWRSAVLAPDRSFRRMLRCASEARARHGTAPWLVRFFDRWHPWLNEPLARVLLYLNDAELWLFRGVMEWPNRNPSSSS